MTGVLDLDELTSAEQRELYDRLAYRFAKDKAPEKTKINAEQMGFWDEIQAAVARHNGVPTARMPLANYLKTTTTEAFERQRKTIENLVVSGCPAITRRPVRMAVQALVLDCLASYLSYNNVPVYFSRMLNNVDKAASAVDACFPGYFNAKMLPRIIALSAN